MNRIHTTRRTVLAGAAAGLFWGYSSPLLASTTGLTDPVKTAAGEVRGLRVGGVSAFLGVPYGADTGPRRFRPPVAPDPWTGVRDCVAWGKQSPQPHPDISMLPPLAQRVIKDIHAGEQLGDESEDCLVLNVYTPEASPTCKRPVMFWLHGGGFTEGSADDPRYDGHALARRGDVVVVTVNHRLNAFGYLYLGGLSDDFADSGNAGQLDILLALQWVRDNIASFGGDPGNVTIFGQSGGGAKVSALLNMPAAEGLFHKAIIQSGPGRRVLEIGQAVEQTEKTLANLGIPKAEFRKLESVDMRSLTGAAMAASAGNPLGLAPVIDGRTLHSHPFEPAAPAQSRNIPLLIGSTKDEMTVLLVNDPAFGTMDEEQAKQRASAMIGEKGPKAIDAYKKLRPDYSPTYLLSSLWTATFVWLDMIKTAELKLAQNGAPVFMYRLDWETPWLNGAMKSPHTIDLPLVFDNTQDPNARAMLGDGPEPKRIAGVMSQAWINFAHTGKPSQAGLEWPAYDTALRQTMIFDVESHLESDPDPEIRILLKV